MLIAVTSSKNAPGATTSALALTLAWPRPVLLAELDPRGGDIVWGYGRGQNVGGAGLLRWQLAVRVLPMAKTVWDEVVELPTEGHPRWWLPGLLEPKQAGAVDWSQVAQALRSLDVDVIADCGSVFGAPDRPHRAVWASADLVALAVRPTLQGVHAARNASGILRPDLMSDGLGPERLCSFLVGCRHGFPTKDVAAELEDVAPVIGELTHDVDTADTLNGLRDQRKKFTRAPLPRDARTLAGELGALATELSNRPATPAVTVAAPVASPRPPFSPPPELLGQRGSLADRARVATPGPADVGVARASAPTPSARRPIPVNRPVVPAVPPPPVPKPAQRKEQTA